MSDSITFPLLLSKYILYTFYPRNSHNNASPPSTPSSASLPPPCQQQHPPSTQPTPTPLQPTQTTPPPPSPLKPSSLTATAPSLTPWNGTTRLGKPSATNTTLTSPARNSTAWRVSQWQTYLPPSFKNKTSRMSR